MHAAGIDLQILLNFASDSTTPARMRRGAAGQSRARAARHDRHSQAMADPQDRRDLRLGLRQHHRHGRGTISGQRVALIGRGVLMAKQNASARGSTSRERGHHLGLALVARRQTRAVPAARRDDVFMADIMHAPFAPRSLLPPCGAVTELPRTE